MEVRYVGESERRAPYGRGHASEHSTPIRQFCLGHREKAVEGEFTTYGRYILVFECLRYLLLASLKFYQDTEGHHLGDQLFRGQRSGVREFDASLRLYERSQVIHLTIPQRP